MAYNPNYQKKQNYDSGGNYGLAPLEKPEVSAIQKIFPDMEEILIKQFFYKAGTKIAASKDRLLWLFEKKFKDQYSIDTDFVSEEVENRVKKSLCFPENSMFLLMKSVITLLDGRKFTEWGTVTATNIKGNKHPVELCATRAKLRAMRDATGAGFCAISEIDNIPEEDNIAQKEKEKAFKRLQILVREAQLSREEKLDIYSSVAGRRIESSKELTVWHIQLAIEKIENRNREVTITEPAPIKKETVPPPDLIEDIDFSFEERDVDEKVIAIQELYIQLKWSEEYKREWFEKYSTSKDKKYQSEEDFDDRQKEEFIKYLNLQIQPEKEKEE